MSNSLYKTKVNLRFNREREFQTIFFIDTDAKIVNRILTNWIQENMQKIIHHDQVDFIPEMQGWLSIRKSINVIYRINKLKGQKKDHLIRCWKSLWQNPTPIHEVLEWLGIKGAYLSIINPFYRKPIINIRLNGETDNTKTKPRQGNWLFPYLSNIITKF